MGFIPVPGIALTCAVAVEDRLVLKLVAAETPSEGVLRPDDLATDFEIGRFNRSLELTLPRGGMANVHRTAGLQRPEIRREHGYQKFLKLPARHLVALNLQLLLGVTFI